ncbi:Regulatory protein PchR [Paenibacillus konkukensis]|uniref:Regulatory protein PchR n=1 Tax=Paenibacillus konkukensis TaxID=2020716 RepID=A0ABY4RJC8_9BACL|nr:AraC family transcriptional regulator [Paenibacillus konkukensis]UQZ82248.1 Regulatory protein PchR [Paenibacillus konkukensis]
MTFHITQVHDLFDQLAGLMDGSVRQQRHAWEQRIDIPSRIGRGSVTRTLIRPGMEIMYTDAVFEQNIRLHIQEACQLFEISYCLSGEIYSEWDGKRAYTGHETGSVLFLEDVLVYEEKKAGIPHQLLEVRLTPSELLHYAGDAAERRQMESWLSRHRGGIDRYPDTPAIRKCISDMIHCTYKGAMKRLYLESKALEWIALFGEADCGDSSSGGIVLKKEDLEKLKQVELLVERHYEQPPTIRELARQVGMNEFKLKKAFREWSGMTIFELVRQKRMEKALWYLEVEQLNIGETAVSVGYSNASNFTANFRKHYGCNPSDYLQRIRRQELAERRMDSDRQRQ